MLEIGYNVRLFGKITIFRTTPLTMFDMLVKKTM
jgi:hypothetical protein